MTSSRVALAVAAAFRLSALGEEAPVVHRFRGLDNGAGALRALVHEPEDLLELGGVQLHLRRPAARRHEKEDVPHVGADAVHDVGDLFEALPVVAADGGVDLR